MYRGISVISESYDIYGHKQSKQSAPSMVEVKIPKLPQSNNSVYKVNLGGGVGFSASNGSAHNWGIPYPSAYLDARTLSFPRGGARGRR